MSGSNGDSSSGFFVNVSTSSESGQHPPIFPSFPVFLPCNRMPEFNLISINNFPVGVEIYHDGVRSVIPESLTPKPDEPAVWNIPHDSSNNSHGITMGGMTATYSLESDTSAALVVSNVFNGNNQPTLAPSPSGYNTFGNGEQPAASSATGSNPLLFQSPGLQQNGINGQCETVATQYCARRKSHVCPYCRHTIQQITGCEKCQVCEQPGCQQNPTKMGSLALEYTRNE